MWNDLLNLVGVEAFSTLRRAKNVYYPPPLLSIIRAIGSLASPDDAASNVASPIEKALSMDPLNSNSPKEVTEQADPIDKEKEVFKEVTPEMTKTSDAPKDPRQQQSFNSPSLPKIDL